MAGSKEDAETVTAFFQDMRARGLGDPLLVVSDGAPGVIKAIETCFPRWRAERGKQVSIALIMPGAPSETTSSGSPSPRARMSWKKAVTVSASSLEPAIRCKSTLAPVAVWPQAAITGSRRWPGRMRSAMPSMNR